MRKLAIVLAVAALLTGVSAGVAQARVSHPAPQLRDTNWPCHSC
jgi:hypothetical protein